MEKEQPRMAKALMMHAEGHRALMGDKGERDGQPLSHLR